MTLPPSIKKKVDKIRGVDIVVGISAKNVDTTILHVMNVVSTGLVEHFSDYRAAVVVVDGYSKDRTVELAKLFELPSSIHKLITEDMGTPGKGSAVRTVFEIGVAADADTVVLVDGDLMSIHPEWLEHLGNKPLYGVADLVVPYYLRHKFDGVITNSLAYPMTKALYNVNLRQPIGGEFGLSIEFVKKLLEHPLFPHDFGIDIFMSNVAAAEKYMIQETLLGLKLHESTTKYADPGKHLIPMFRQVVGRQFLLMEYYENKWNDGEEEVDMKVKRAMAKSRGQKPTPLKVDRSKFNKAFREGYADSRVVLKSCADSDVLEELDKISKSDDPYLPPDLWVKTVYNLAAAHKKSRTPERMYILDALRTVWLLRYSSFVKEAFDLNEEESEKLLVEQADLFVDNLDYLKSIY